MPTPTDLSRLLMAATFAADRHRDHRRNDTEESPYINHPLAVAALLAEEGGVTDVELLIAALLHDTVEDTATSHDEIAEQFGSEVGGLVAEVTDDKSLPKESRKELQVEHAPGTSDRGKQLKIADKIANIRGMDATAPKDWDIARKIEYLDWAERVVSRCRDVNAVLDQLFDQAVRQARDRLDVSVDDLGPFASHPPLSY